MTAVVSVSPEAFKMLVAAISAPQEVGPTSLDLPSWVQAVGSIVAILASIWIAHRDTRIRRREKIAADGNFALFIDSATSRLVKSVVEILQRFSQDLDEAESGDSDFENLRQIYVKAIDEVQSTINHIPAMIRSIPLTEWPDMQFAHIFHDNVLAVEELVTQMRRSLKDVESANDEEECYDFVRGMAVVSSESVEYFEYSFDSSMQAASQYISTATKRRVKLNDKMPPVRPWE